MSRITVAVEIAATSDAVWAHLEQLERHVDWMADAESISFHGDQRRGVGTRLSCLTKVGPLRLRDEMEVIAWDAPRTIGVRHRGVVTGTGTFQLEPIDLDRRTRCTWSEELRFPWFLGGGLGALIGGQAVLKRIWRHNLARFKHTIETGE